MLFWPKMVNLIPLKTVNLKVLKSERSMISRDKLPLMTVTAIYISHVNLEQAWGMSRHVRRPSLCQIINSQACTPDRTEITRQTLATMQIMAEGVATG